METVEPDEMPLLHPAGVYYISFFVFHKGYCNISKNMLLYTLYAEKTLKNSGFGL